MQTFITECGTRYLEICKQTARDLDSQRLGKQRAETKQIYNALVDGVGWIHHPATKMWAGHVEALAVYGMAMCAEYRNRGFNDSLLPWFEKRTLGKTECNHIWPWWFGKAEMVATHRSKLIRKLPGRYTELFYFDHWAKDYALPYLWPNPNTFGHYTISAAEYELRNPCNPAGYELPPHWEIDPLSRVVTFAGDRSYRRAADDGVLYE